MHAIIISIGSNTAEKHRNVEAAIQWLSGWTVPRKQSSVYESQPEGNCAGKVRYTYANAVFCALTSHSREEIEAKLKKYEADCGRTPQMKAFGIVPIDLDLVVFDNHMLRPNEMDRNYFRRGYDEIFPEE